MFFELTVIRDYEFKLGSKTVQPYSMIYVTLGKDVINARAAQK